MLYSARVSHFFLFTIICLIGCSPQTGNDHVYASKTLLIERIDRHVYRHISLLMIPDYGSFPCNGLVYMKDGAAVVIDTPVDEDASEELIAWIESRGAEVRAVVPTHFHVDCLGGLGAFHERGVPSYAHTKTIALAEADDRYPLPQNGFDERFTFEDGLAVHLEHPGAGHTRDNIVAWLPEERVLFGGCLVKELGAGRGNLADADTLAWSATVREVKRLFSGARVVVPGHGAPGSVELLDYTIEMFDPTPR